jgi:hypothetical protein
MTLNSTSNPVPNSVSKKSTPRNASTRAPAPAQVTARKPRIVLALLIAMCGLFIFSYTSRLAEKARLDEQIALVQAQIAVEEENNFRLLELLEQSEEPSYLGNMARRIFDFALPGDTVLMIDGASTTLPEADAVGTLAATNSIDFRNFPIWQQWVVFFTTDSFAISLQ